jgi:hypothetical protein
MTTKGIQPMRKLVALGAVCVTAATMTACGTDWVSNTANDVCRDRGGVLAVDYSGDTVVCGDKIARSLDD